MLVDDLASAGDDAGISRKLELNPKCPEWILTVRRFGYRFAD